jgi:hypothetical protein
MCRECVGRGDLEETDPNAEHPWCRDCHHWIGDAPAPPPRTVVRSRPFPELPLSFERPYVTGGCPCECKGSSVVFRRPT